MGKFTYTDPQTDPQGVTIFQRSLDTIRAEKAATTRKDRDMPLSTSASDLAWSAVYALAQEMVRAREAADVRAAVDLLREVNHPVYERYLAASASDRPPQDAADVVKRATVDQRIVKRNQVMDQITKRATALVRAGLAATEAEGRREVFKQDPALYEAYRQASYSKGPGVPPAPPEVATVTTGPVYDQVRKMALALKQQDDPWGQFAGKSEGEMVQVVFDRHPDLFTAYRNEAYNRG